MRTETPWILRNPINGFIWSRHLGHGVSELSGNYTTYLSEGSANAAKMRNVVTRELGYIAEPDPATIAALAKGQK